MPIVSFNATPLFYANLITTLLCIFILAFVAPIKLKRNYHVTFSLFVASLIWFAFIGAMAQGSLTLQTFWSFIPWQTIGGPYVSLGLMYLFGIQFARLEITLGRKAVLAAAFGFYAFQIVTIFSDEPLWAVPYGRVTPMGFGGASGPIFSYLAPLGINIPFAILAILVLSQMISYYRDSKSKLVRSQLKYLIGGTLFYYVAIAGGVFNLVFQTFPTTSNSLFRAIAAGILLIGLTRHGFYSIGPALEEVAHVDVGYDVADGHSYLGLAKKTSFGVFAALVKNGRNGLCITTTLPDEVRANYGLEKTPVRWLSDSERDDAITPTDLPGMSAAIIKFLNKAEKPTVMLDGIDLLVSENGFRPTMSLINKLSGVNAQRGGVLIISSMASASAPGQRPFLEVLGEASLIEARLEVQRVVEVGEEFEFQIDVFNVSKKPAFLERVENAIPKRFRTVSSEPLKLKFDGSSVLMGGRRLEPLKLESVKFMLRAEEAGEDTFAPRIVYRNDDGVESIKEVELTTIKVLPAQELEFESKQGQSIFAYLTKAFLDDYMTSRYPLDRSGWRSITQVSKDTGIPASSLYGREGKYGQVVYELLSRALIEQRVFTEHRGRGGEIAKYRVAYDREPIKRFIDRTILRRN